MTIFPLLVLCFSAAIAAATGFAVHKARIDMKEARKAHRPEPTVGRAVWPYLKRPVIALAVFAVLLAAVVRPVAPELSGGNALLANMTIPLWIAAVVLLSLWVQVLAMRTSPTATGLALLGIFALVVVGFSTAFLCGALLGPYAQISLISEDMTFAHQSPLPAMVLLVAIHAGALWLVLRAKRPKRAAHKAGKPAKA